MTRSGYSVVLGVISIVGAMIVRNGPRINYEGQPDATLSAPDDICHRLRHER